MSDFIYSEIELFVVSLFAGVFLVVAYDVFRCIRILIKHNAFFTALEDIIFWLIAAITIFFVLYTFNDGSIRAYSILGMLIGMLVYSNTISRAFIYLFAKITQYIGKTIKKICAYILKPIKLFRKNVLKLLKKFINNVKIILKTH